jgi:hypothetical protein
MITGLTEFEIKEAFRLADVQYSTASNAATEIINRSSSSQPTVVANDSKNLKKTSIWSRLFKWIRNILLAGCLSYTAFQLLIKVISLICAYVHI